jgi:hypothetical protein
MPSWEDEPLADLAKRPLTKEEERAIGPVNWNKLTGVPFKYLDHVMFARMDGVRLVTPPKPSPYANIVVQPLGASDTGMMQLAHKMDYFNLYLLENQGVLDPSRWDVIVRHKRPSGIKRVLASVLPHIEYSVYFAGYFDEAESQDEIEELLENEPYIYAYDQERLGFEDWIMDFNPPI